MKERESSSATGLRSKTTCNFEMSEGSEASFVEQNVSSKQRSATTNRKERELRTIRLQRMAGRIILIFSCLGGTSIVSANVVFAYLSGGTCTLSSRRMNPANTRTVVSSSKIFKGLTNQINATNDDSDMDERLENLRTETRDMKKKSYSSNENFFHGDDESVTSFDRRPDDMHNLERYLNGIDDKKTVIRNLDGISRKLKSKQGNDIDWNEITNQSLEGSEYLTDSAQAQAQFSFEGAEESLVYVKSNHIISQSSSIFRRIRPLKRIKRIFGGSFSRSNNETPTAENHINQMTNETMIGNTISAFELDDNNGYYSDDFRKGKKPSLRRLWRKRNARTLEEGIRRERRNTLSFLMNKAIINARPSQERSYIERSLMGLINGLAEEVEDLDIELNTVSKTPFWRKEVDEIRINFSRLGFRPLQLGGTNSVIEITELDDRYDYDKNGKANNRIDTISSGSQQGGSDVNNGVTELSFVECADEGFDRIDEDGSGTLDKDELALALSSISGFSTNKDSIEELASDLVRLYDDDGDGVVDREEYQQMVEDMAKLRSAKDSEEDKNQKNPFVVVKDSIQSVSEGISNKAGEVVSAARDKYFSEKNEEEESETEMGSIVLSKVNLDLRRLVFGAVPVIKKITPGGPLILEPFTATVTASLSCEDVAGSFLIDAALRRLVARVLRVRVRSYRDLVEGALFVGRRWKMTCKTAPVVEVLELSDIEFDSRDKLVVTGKARIRADPDAPIVTSTFKLRTKIGTRKNGQVIKIKEPELAFVFECPKFLEKGFAATCEMFGLPPPKRPEPYYSFFPIYSPFKVEDDTGGFDMGEDNCIRSIFIRNGKLRFEMSVVLRPGRFLGNHYLAFTVPQRTFIITMDRVWNGVRSARENKQVADRVKKLKEEEDAKAAETLNSPSNIISESTLALPPSMTKKSSSHKGSIRKPLAKRWRFFKTIKENTPKPKSFYNRFVEGYTMVEREEEANNERITNDISAWFGRQGQNDNVTKAVVDELEEDEEQR